jgi:hypothetical protein
VLLFHLAGGEYLYQLDGTFPKTLNPCSSGPQNLSVSGFAVHHAHVKGKRKYCCSSITVAHAIEN